MEQKQQQNQPEKESFTLFGILMGVIGLSLLAVILKLIGLV